METERPRVLALIATPILGGPGKGLLQLARHLDSHHTELLLATFSYRGRRSELWRRAREQNTAIALLNQRFRIDPLPAIQALRLVEERGINLLQSHGYKSHLVAWWVAARTGLPWLAFAHGWTAESRKARLYNRIEQALLRRATLAVAVSRPLHETLTHLRGSRRPTELLLNAVDPQELRREAGGAALRARLGMAPQHLAIGCFGRLSREKGHVHLLQALAALGTTAARFKLVVVGDGPERAHLQTLSERLGLARCVHFEGYRENMGDYFDAVDMVVLPSISEGTPNVVLEALALGRPVLASRVGGIGDLIIPGVNGWLVTPGRSDELAATLQHIAAQPEDVAELGARAAGSLQACYQPAFRAQRLQELYCKLLAGLPAAHAGQTNGGMA